MLVVVSAVDRELGGGVQHSADDDSRARPASVGDGAVRAASPPPEPERRPNPAGVSSLAVNSGSSTSGQWQSEDSALLRCTYANCYMLHKFVLLYTGTDALQIGVHVDKPSQTLSAHISQRWSDQWFSAMSLQVYRDVLMGGHVSPFRICISKTASRSAIVFCHICIYIYKPCIVLCL